MLPGDPQSTQDQETPQTHKTPPALHTKHDRTLLFGYSHTCIFLTADMIFTSKNLVCISYSFTLFWSISSLFFHTLTFSFKKKKI